MGEHLPLILVEVVLVFGAAVGFYVWQMRDLRRAREKRREEVEAEKALGGAEAEEAAGTPDPPDSGRR